jgi:hypothetical protein
MQLVDDHLSTSPVSILTITCENFLYKDLDIESRLSNVIAPSLLAPIEL